MYYLRLIGTLLRASAQQEMAYRANFFVSLLQSLLNLGTGLIGIWILFQQVKTIQGWNFSETLALLGVYLIMSALQGLFISPSFNALAGLDGDIWQGRFDFTLLRPVPVQFLVSFQRWQIFVGIDLILGSSTLLVAIIPLMQHISLVAILAFLIALVIGLSILYSILLILVALVFWSPGFLFTWIFNSLFQMARYPTGLYPGWLQFVLTWIIPIGIITTVPIETLTSQEQIPLLIGSAIVAIVLFTGGSVLFQTGLRRYASASS